MRYIRLRGRSDDSAQVERLLPLLRLPKYLAGQLPWRGHTLQYADAPATYYQLADIYANRVYDFECDCPNPRILDIGGHIGLASLRFRELYPEARLTIFEPDPKLVEILRANLAAFGDIRSEVLAAAAWVDEGTQPFAYRGDDSGALDPNSPHLVSTVDVAKYCEQPVDFLKMDVEGAEYALLSHLALTGGLTRVSRLCVELHQWSAGVPRFHETLTLLVAAGMNYRIQSVATFASSVQTSKIAGLIQPVNLVGLYAWRDGVISW